ncbi:hypothetical protein LIER_17370 [Lithospermum erythrorhizon]|uniref:GRF-type domain-containing protein n=1 Tax=Lithospermum erythrorhizon TaxID=34254 RepID=A0AAV3QCC3_LITER
MSPQVSDLKCQCGRNAMEWIRYNQKNPDRRFIRCPDPVSPCRFWKWIDDPVPLLVRHAMDMNMKKSDKKAKLLGVALVIFNSEDGTSTFGIFLRKMGPKLL